MLALYTKFFSKGVKLLFLHVLVDNDNCIIDVSALDDALVGKGFHFTEKAEGSARCKILEKFSLQIKKTRML